MPAFHRFSSPMLICATCLCWQFKNVSSDVWLPMVTSHLHIVLLHMPQSLTPVTNSMQALAFWPPQQVIIVTAGRHDTIRYDTRCYFNVRSKANMSQLNLPHGNRQLKNVKTEKTKIRKQICPKITVNSPGNRCSKYLSRKKGRAAWERFVEKEGFKPGKKE